MTQLDAQVFEKLLGISRQLAENRELDPLLDYAMDVALELVGAEYGYLILLGKGEALDFRVKRDCQKHELEQPEAQISQTIFEQVIRDQKDLLVANAVEHPDFQAAKSVRLLQIRSVMCTPLNARGKTLGAIYIENRSLENAFSEQDLKVLKFFSGQAATAIENAMLNEDLEARVAARTAELKRANEHLEQLISELNAFAHTVAHGLKNPLGLILGSAGLLEDVASRMSDKDAHIFVQGILTNAAKMGEIIESLLLLANVREMGSVTMARLEMAEIVQDVLKRVGPMAESSHAVITAPEKWPRALGYSPWVEEVWVNYLTNALKYGGKPPRIELGADKPREDGMIRFWIRDNGSGLTKEQCSRLFTPFTRLSRQDVEGHGLGLSIVQRMVEKLGGEVGVESSPGVGSTFYFALLGVPD